MLGFNLSKTNFENSLIGRLTVMSTDQDVRIIVEVPI
jgi:hypothetical protein